MATTHRSELIDELEKALRDEVYDGGFGALLPDQLTDYVRGLAVTAAKVVEEALPTPQNDHSDGDKGRGTSQHHEADEDRDQDRHVHIVPNAEQGENRDAAS